MNHQPSTSARIGFDNSYARLPEVFFERIKPEPVQAASLICWNGTLARELGLDLEGRDEKDLAEFFSGNSLLPGSDPIAMAYAGHQFGHFVPQLGDGRAILLGEVVDRQGLRRDIQLKGSGPTRFSRGGDGRAALGPVMREFILSESMHALGVPTTRSLAAVTTGERVYREDALPGAILTRVASSHIRIGTFEFFAAREDWEGVKRLADYVIDRHYPKARAGAQPYVSFFESVIEAQAYLIAKWMSLGFIHGVMNTDNMTVSGETIDYGPCAFMDEYDPARVYSSIDRFGRYAFGHQAAIAQWNLRVFGATLQRLLGPDKRSANEILDDKCGQFLDRFNFFWNHEMARKLGLADHQDPDAVLARDFLALMARSGADFTLSFRYLSDALEKRADAGHLEHLLANKEDLHPWLRRWRELLAREGRPPVETRHNMRSVNPAFIPRNHRVEQAIAAAVDRADFSKMKLLLEVLEKPYEDQPENREYLLPPKSEERVLETFCGT